ncbi:MAG TPA: FMN-binding negative transcriptional regulator [Verrucomicrobiae bacterium]|nr:FMN-binding negative transcriptional regulator [Verrucomicrobiae bacterium]
MYTPPDFAVTDRAWVLESVARYPFGLLVTCDGEYPLVSHVPMLARERGDDLVVVGHVARANPHARAILEGRGATAVFNGPHAYVSASWYEEPYRTVPTWNYTAVHAEGVLAPCDARDLVDALARTFEEGREDPWEMRRLDPGYLERQLRGIVAFELRVRTLRAKAKLSQNRTPADRERVEAALAASDREIERACAAEMRALR